MSKPTRAWDQIEGKHAVLEALRAGRRRVRVVSLVRPKQHDGEIAEITELAAQTKAQVQQLSAEQIRSLARTEVHQGVVARAEPIPAADIEELLSDPEAFLVTVDGVTDPQNLGAIIRSAEVAGATGFLLPTHRNAGITPTTAKAAAGAIEYLPIAEIPGVPAAMELAKQHNVWTVALDAKGDIDVFEIPVADRPILLILGAEDTGPAELTKRKADVVARIPMHGSTESLNVSAAAAVACFAIRRARATP